MVPGQGAPNAGAPATCSRASAAPKWRAAAAAGRPGGSISMTSMSASTEMTSGSGTAPAEASQRSPLASAASSAARAPPTACLTNTSRPSASVPARCRTPCDEPISRSLTPAL